MAKINELGLTNEKLDISYEDVPEEGGGFKPTPQPGEYRFALPGDLSSVWEAFQASVPTSNKKETRIAAVFTGESALTITWADKDTDRVGDKFFTRISNAERRRGKEGTPVSDLQYLIMQLEPGSTPKTHEEFAQVLQKHAGEEFGASVEWSAYCNPNKPVWMEDEGGTVAEHPDLPGCGNRYYQRDLTKTNGIYAERVTCECGASLRCFGNLTRFKAPNGAATSRK